VSGTDLDDRRPYDRRFKRDLNALAPGLWARLDTVPTLEPPIRDTTMRYLLELACQVQNIRNIEIGRAALASLPRDWALHHIERYAEPLAATDDEWAFRRLGEVYELLGADTSARRLAAPGEASSKPEIREAAQDLLDRRERRT